MQGASVSPTGRALEAAGSALPAWAQQVITLTGAVPGYEPQQTPFRAALLVYWSAVDGRKSLGDVRMGIRAFLRKLRDEARQEAIDQAVQQATRQAAERATREAHAQAQAAIDEWYQQQQRDNPDMPPPPRLE